MNEFFCMRLGDALDGLDSQKREKKPYQLGFIRIS